MLKIVAIIAMLMDHIWAFIPDTPYYFHWIGRISAPVFIYCCIVSYSNTKSKKKYLARLYIFSLIMGIVNYFLNIQYNFIRTLFIIVIIIYVVEKFKSKDKNAKKFCLIFSLWQMFIIVCVFLLEYTVGLRTRTVYMFLTISFNVLGLDGGLFFVFIGVMMYIYIDNKEKLAISYVIVCFLCIIIYNTVALRVIFDILERISEVLYAIFEVLSKNIFGVHPAFMQTDFLYGDPQWMMILALPIILMYNGEKGRGLKYLFYVFYPVHIIILYFIGKNILGG